MTHRTGMETNVKGKFPQWHGCRNDQAFTSYCLISERTRHKLQALGSPAPAWSPGSPGLLYVSFFQRTALLFIWASHHILKPSYCPFVAISQYLLPLSMNSYQLTVLGWWIILLYLTATLFLPWCDVYTLMEQEWQEQVLQCSNDTQIINDHASTWCWINFYFRSAWVWNNHYYIFLKYDFNVK